MNTLIDIIFKALQPGLQDSLTSTMNEGTIKSCIVEKLLRDGYRIIEGPKTVFYMNNKIITFPTETRVSRNGTSADIRIIRPIQAVIELQARSDISSQYALASAPIADDIQRVEEGRADLFILVADEGIFRSMRGDRSNRGRKPLHPELFPTYLAASDIREVRTAFNTSRFCIFYTRKALGAHLDELA